MAVKFGILADGDPLKTTALPELSRVEVREKLGETITYTVVFAEDVCDGDFQLFRHPSFLPLKQIEIWVETENKKKVYLVKGPVKGQQIKIMNGGQGSELQVQGTDNSVRMKQVEGRGNHRNQTDSTIVNAILQRNGFTNTEIVDHGLENDESQHSRMQNQDDLSLIKSIAREHGLYFWISYDNNGNEVAHFNELPLDSTPSKRLIINGDNVTQNNIDELSINWNADVPTDVVGQQLNTRNRERVDTAVAGSPQEKLGLVALRDLVRQEVRGTARPADDSGRGQQRSTGALNEAEWFIKASCSTSFDRLCKVIHAHTLVEVVGAGNRHSGKYVVSGVTHTIDVSSYKMQLELMRNAWDPQVTENGKSGTGI